MSNNTTVKFESYEDVRKANEERRKEINECNNGLRSSGNYQLLYKNQKHYIYSL